MPSKRDNTTPADPRVHTRLAAFRRKRGMAAAGLARASGVSRQTIYAIEAGDRKSTRLNSSHLCISYAVFFFEKMLTRLLKDTARQRAGDGPIRGRRRPPD